MAVDNDRLMEFLGKFVGDLGATAAAGNIVIGHRLGLCAALARGPATPEQLAERTDTSPRYVTEWRIPAMDGLEAKLTDGARVADIGCGLGASSVIMAGSYPRSTVAGSDYHDGSIEPARKRAADAGVATRATFEVASAQTFTGTGYDLVTSFDCLHDMGDPLGAARHVRQAMASDGTWLVVEPIAADTVEGNLNPVGRLYYGFSSFLCVPNGLSQPGGYSLGAQAGEAAMRQVMTDAGFTRFRRVR